MPYKSLKDIPNGLKGIEPPISLEQANEIAAQADAIPESEGVSPWGAAINSFKKRYAVQNGRWVKRTEEAATEPVAEAATYKAAALRLVADMKALMADRTVPAALKKEIEDVQVMLRRTWADLEAEASGAERPAPKEVPPPEEDIEPTEEADAGFFNDALLERTFVTLPDKRRVSLAACVRAYQRVSEDAEPQPEPQPEPVVATEPAPVALPADKAAAWGATIADIAAWLAGAKDMAGAQGAPVPTTGTATETQPVAEAAMPGEGGAPQGSPSDPSDVTARGYAEAAPVIEYADGADREVQLQETAFAESESGHVLALAEAMPAQWDGQGPLKLRTVLIEAGPGNSRDKHYYPVDVLAKCAPIFQGRKMYPSDHRAEEKNAGTDVADILKCPVGFTATGGIIAEVGIFDPGFGRKVYNRAQMGTLNNLKVSIVGTGKTRPGTVNGKGYDVVTDITNGAADFVSEAGAGGQALAIAEAATEASAPQEEGRKVLTKEQVQEALAKLTGPQPVKERLAGREYETAEAIAEALRAEVAYITEASGAGKPVGIGESGEPPKARTRTWAEHEAAMAALFESWKK